MPISEGLTIRQMVSFIQQSSSQGLHGWHSKQEQFFIARVESSGSLQTKMEFCSKHLGEPHMPAHWYLPPMHGCQNLEHWSEQTGYLAVFFRHVARSLPQSHSANNFSRVHVQQMKATSIGVSF